METKRLRILDFSQAEMNLYYEINHAHTIEDIVSRYNCTFEEADVVAERVSDTLDKLDSYFEMYWFVVERAAEAAGLKAKPDELDKADFPCRYAGKGNIGVCYKEGSKHYECDCVHCDEENSPKCLRCANCPGDLMEQDDCTMFCPASGGGFANGEEDIDCDCFEELEMDCRNVGGR